MFVNQFAKSQRFAFLVNSETTRFWTFLEHHNCKNNTGLNNTGLNNAGLMYDTVTLDTYRSFIQICAKVSNAYQLDQHTTNIIIHSETITEKPL